MGPVGGLVLSVQHKVLCGAEPLPPISFQRSGRHCPRAASSWNLGGVGQIIKCVWNQTPLGWKETVVSPSVMLFLFTQNHSVCCTGMFIAGECACL